MLFATVSTFQLHDVLYIEKKLINSSLKETTTVLGLILRADLYLNNVLTTCDRNYCCQHRIIIHFSPISSLPQSYSEFPSPDEFDESASVVDRRCSSAKRILTTMFDFKLLLSPTFLSVSMSGVFVFLGIFSIQI